MEVTDAAAAAAPRFAIEGAVRDVRPHPGGHIHRSFVVTASERRYLLQRMNTDVFRAPELVMDNIAAVTAHLVKRGQRTLTVIPARAGGSLVRDHAGGCWRMFDLIEGVVTRERANDAADAGSAARAFGQFQRALEDYRGPRLHVTMPGFHDTLQRVAALDLARAEDWNDRAGEAADAFECVDRHRSRLANFFMAAQVRYEAIVRVAHHDAKIANLLFDAASGEPICVVDLDTVMPGLSLFDFGDLVRSMVSPAAEDEPDPSRGAAEPARFAAIVRGYLDGVHHMLSADERGLLPFAAEAMVFEQGVRFLTDHLEGDEYYRIDRAGQNLDRARTQFALLESLVQQEAEFSRMVAKP